MNLKRFLLLSGLILSLAIFTGCGSNEKAREKAATDKANPEIVMWLVGSEAQAIVINDIAKDYQEELGYRVRCEAISWGEAHSKYLTSVAGEVTPDIGTTGLTWATEFGSLGAMVDLKEAFPDDVARIEKETFRSIWNSAVYKGKTYGIPFDMSLQILFYRHDIVPEPPKTWEELSNLLVSLKQVDKGMLFDWGSMSWIGYSPFLWQAGGDFYNTAGTASTLNSPEAILGLKFFSELYTIYGVPKTSIPMEQGMRTGDFPLAISGNWNIDSLRLLAPEIMGKWSIAPLPQGPTGKRTAFIGGRTLGIFNLSPHKKEAWDFIKFLFQPEIQIRLYKEAQNTQDTYLPPNMITWQDLPIDANFKAVLELQALDAQGPPPVLGWDNSTRYIEEAIQRVILQNADIAEALKKAATEVTAQIKNQ